MIQLIQKVEKADEPSTSTAQHLQLKRSRQSDDVPRDSSKDMETVKTSKHQLDDHDSSEEESNASDENTAGRNRASKPNFRIPEDVQKTYDDAVNESQDVMAVVAHIEKCIPKATKSRKKELKCKLRKARHSAYLLTTKIADLRLTYPSLDRDTQSEVNFDDDPDDQSEQRQHSPVKTVHTTDETLVRKNHWPDDTSKTKEVPTRFIYVDTEDEEPSPI